MRQNLQCFRFLTDISGTFLRRVFQGEKSGCFSDLTMLQYLSVKNKCPCAMYMQGWMHLYEIRTVRMAETGKGMAVIWERPQDILLLNRKRYRKFY